MMMRTTAPKGEDEELGRILGDDEDHFWPHGDNADPERILVVAMVGGDPWDAVITGEGFANGKGSLGS
jgi:hypothetical protein